MPQLAQQMQPDHRRRRWSSAASKSRDTDPGRPGETDGQRLSLEDVRSQIVFTTVDSPKGNIEARRAPTRSTPRQMINAKDWNASSLAYRNGAVADPRHRPAVSGPEDRQAGAWANGNAACVLVVFKQPGANVIDTVDRSNWMLPAAVCRIRRRDQDRRHQRRTPDHSRRRRGRSVHPAFDHCAGRHGHLRIPAQLLGDGDPTVTVLSRCSALRADVGIGYTLDNLSADGADHRGGLRRPTTPSCMLENITRYIEERREADGRRFQGRQRNRFHDRINQHFAGRGVLIPLLLMGGIIGGCSANSR